MAKDKKEYDMLRDMMGSGSLEKPTQKSTLPKFFKFVPDPYTATDKVMDKIKKKSKKKKKGGGLTETVPPKRGPNPQGLKKGGCPHREAGVRSPYQGVSGIQVKGQKFTGVK